jgi:hypothetical protein
MSVTPEPALPQIDLHQSANLLPRTPRGTLDTEAGLRLFGLSDPSILWRQKFKVGTAGAALKRTLGAQGRKPKHSPIDQAQMDLDTYPASELPLLPGTRKLDLVASLALFNIQDPAVLWTKRFRPTSAGGRLKMCLRASGFALNTADANSSATRVQCVENPAPPPEKGLLNTVVAKETNSELIRRNADGQIDIQASMHALGINDARSLWRNPVEPGSVQHTLKKEIARVLARREIVPGINRADIGLTI